VTVIGVPYHLDEYLPDLDLSPDPAELITPELPPAEVAGAEIWPRLAVLYTAVARAVTRNRAADGRPVVVASGDCLTALGTVAGLQAAGAGPAIVWFDAHGDVQTPETSSSGYLAGMVLRLLTGYRPELIAGRLDLKPVRENRIVLVGACDLDPPEATYLDQSQICRREVTDLRRSAPPAAPRRLRPADRQPRRSRRQPPRGDPAEVTGRPGDARLSLRRAELPHRPAVRPAQPGPQGPARRGGHHRLLGLGQV